MKEWLWRTMLRQAALRHGFLDPFTLLEKGFGSAPSVEEGRIVFQLDKVTSPPPLNEAETKRLEHQLGLLMSEDAIAEYFSALKTRYGVTINQQALAKLIGSGEEP